MKPLVVNGCLIPQEDQAVILVLVTMKTAPLAVMGAVMEEVMGLATLPHRVAAERQVGVEAEVMPTVLSEATAGLEPEAKFGFLVGR